MDRYEIGVRVISVTGTCAYEHKVGDEWVIKSTTPAGICITAFGCILPSVQTLMFGGSFPWEEDQNAAKVACPDPNNPVVFELRRLRKVK